MRTRKSFGLSGVMLAALCTWSPIAGLWEQ